MATMKDLLAVGQSVWLDYIRRQMLDDGEMERLVENGLRGMTSNPSIFEKAISEGGEYDDQIESILREDPEISTGALFEALAVADIRRAADFLRGVYDSSDGNDGYISLEVSPHLADKTEETIGEARRLWTAVDRPNLMIKVPATPAGIPAIKQLISEGINVNITLMFSIAHYDAVAGAYINGLEAGGDPKGIASVASFFVSRVDTRLDPKLDAMQTKQATELRGKVAVANAKLAYARYRKAFEGKRFEPYREKGAKVQRVLYGSTSTKDDAYSDVKYVEELIGPDTVNTIPPETLDAFLDHGTVAVTLTEGLEEAHRVMDRLAALGIDIDAETEALQREGVEKFSQAFDKLMVALDRKRAEILAQRV
jgi:transaldolase